MHSTSVPYATQSGHTLTPAGCVHAGHSQCRSTLHQLNFLHPAFFAPCQCVVRIHLKYACGRYLQDCLCAICNLIPCSPANNTHCLQRVCLIHVTAEPKLCWTFITADRLAGQLPARRLASGSVMYLSGEIVRHRLRVSAFIICPSAAASLPVKVAILQPCFQMIDCCQPPDRCAFGWQQQLPVML